MVVVYIDIRYFAEHKWLNARITRPAGCAIASETWIYGHVNVRGDDFFLLIFEFITFVRLTKRFYVFQTLYEISKILAEDESLTTFFPSEVILEIIRR